MKMETEHQVQSGAQLTWGLCCTAVLGTAYGAFLLLSACYPQILATRVTAGSEMTWAFAFGFAVIALGVFLTWLYAFVANQRERKAEQAASAETRQDSVIGRTP